jgi:hypothetical protein
MSQETYPFRIEVRRGDEISNITLNLTLRQAAGLDLMSGLLRRLGAINGYAVISIPHPFEPFFIKRIIQSSISTGQ